MRECRDHDGVHASVQASESPAVHPGTATTPVAAPTQRHSPQRDGVAETAEVAKQPLTTTAPAEMEDEAKLIGRRVVLQRLQRQEMNGRLGRVLSVDQSTGRCAIKLENGDVVKIKKSNLELRGGGGGDAGLDSTYDGDRSGAQASASCGGGERCDTSWGGCT